MIKLATVFSGIGAIESALDYLNLEKQIIFACDNGERELNFDYAQIDKMMEGKSDYERQKIIKKLYDDTGRENLVKKTYFANYKINGNQWFEDISQYYDENVANTNAIVDNIIKLHFTKKYDSQNRYYLNFKKDGFSSLHWDFLRNIALPRVTKLNFVKVKDIKTNKLYIYIKPSFFIDEKEVDEKADIVDLLAGNKDAVINRRKGQVQWRQNLLDIMPACVITKVTEDRILEACHIKPHNISTDKEMYDVHNALIMTPTYHKLFDLGFISFNDNGTILVSPFLSNMNKQRLNIDDGKQYRIPKECAIYLAYHRANIYNQIPDLQL